MKNKDIYVYGGFELPTKEEYKFIKLFEEYLVKYNSEYGPINCSINIPGITLMGIHESVIISKEYGFIKRLVEHDKINTPAILDELPNLKGGEYDYSKSDRLIMLLSISENPISDLCSYIK